MGRILVALLVLLFSTGAYPAIYKCKGSNGQWIYSDKPGVCNKIRALTAQESKAAPAIAEDAEPATRAMPDGSGQNPKTAVGEAAIPQAQAALTARPVANRVSAKPAAPAANSGFKEKLGYLLTGIGIVLSIYYGIVLLFKAFQTSLWWGLGYLFIPFVSLAFVVIHWDTAKRPFLLSFLALPFLLAGLALMPYSFTGGGGGAPEDMPTRGVASPEEPLEASAGLPQGAPAHVQQALASAGQNRYRCEGKTRCSEMESCEEAKFYLAHCPDVQMDGNHDGIPCERQWCGH